MTGVELTDKGREVARKLAADTAARIKAHQEAQAARFANGTETPNDIAGKRAREALAALKALKG
jgi:hypothetical protein